MPATQLPQAVMLSRLLPDVALATGQDVPVTGLALDSRKVVPGDLFLAVKGAVHDGRDHIRQAIAAGCVAVVADAEDFESFVGANTVFPVPVITVAVLVEQLSAIAGRFYRHPSRAMTLIGVTGTNGKTTCTYLLAQLFAAAGQSAGVLGTLGYGLIAERGVATEGGGDIAFAQTGMTTPDALQTQRVLARMQDQGAEVVAMEVSSHSLHQHRVTDLAFDVAVFTNLSRDHLDYHGDLAQYGAAKAALFAMPGLNVAVINGDDEFGRQLAAQVPSGCRLVTYGLAAGADVTASDIHYSPQGISAQIHGPWGTGRMNSALLGHFNLSNLLAVVAAACAAGLELGQVLDLLPVLKPVPGRMEVVSLPGVLPGVETMPRVVIDYAHTPDALENVLRALRRHCQGRLWCVFGCGGDRDSGKRPQMGAIAADLADVVLVTSDNPRSEDPAAIIEQIVAGIPADKKAGIEADRRAAILQAITTANADDTVLIAGKGHEDYQQVGVTRLPFSDCAEARLALRQRQVADRGDQGGTAG